MFLNLAEFVPCASINQICVCAEAGREELGVGDKKKTKRDGNKKVSSSRCAAGNGTADGLHLERLHVRFTSETEDD